MRLIQHLMWALEAGRRGRLIQDNDRLHQGTGDAPPYRQQISRGGEHLQKRRLR